jgi:DNA-directed RNA polymerase specialized sigma24 family protein
MALPSGTFGLYSSDATEKELEITQVIELIVRIKKNSYVGGMYDDDDLAQELRIRLLKAAESLNQDAPPYNFLMRCAENFIIDKRRGVYQYNNPPCSICAAGGACQPDGSQCKAWRNYEKNLKIKRQLDSPIPLGDSDVPQFDITYETIVARELQERIIRALPASLLKAYKRMVQGGEEDITTTQRHKIRAIVRKLVEDERGLMENG